MNRKLTKKDKEANRYLKQISVLRQRLTLNRATEHTIAFICNCCYVFAFAEHYTIFGIVFMASLVMFGFSY